MTDPSGGEPTPIADPSILPDGGHGDRPGDPRAGPVAPPGEHRFWPDPATIHSAPASIWAVGALGVLVMIVVGLLVLRSTVGTGLLSGGTPRHRSLPAPAHDTVLLVPIGPVADDALARVADDYRAEYGLHVGVAAPIPLEPIAFDPGRGQYEAHGLIDSMAAAHPELVGSDQVIIGITSADLYLRDVDWNWAFALREGGRLAVVSTARMTSSRSASQAFLMRKMLTREIGFLCYQLAPSDDPRDVLYRDILGLSDLQRIGDHL